MTSSVGGPITNELVRDFKPVGGKNLVWLEIPEVFEIRVKPPAGRENPVRLEIIDISAVRVKPR